MARRRSLEEIIASDPRFKNVDPAIARRYYESVLDSQRANNPTALKEVVVTAPSARKIGNITDSETKQKVQQAITRNNEIREKRLDLPMMLQALPKSIQNDIPMYSIDWHDGRQAQNAYNYAKSRSRYDFDQPDAAKLDPYYTTIPTRIRLSGDTATMNRMRLEALENGWSEWKKQNPSWEWKSQTETDANWKHRQKVAEADRLVKNTAFSDEKTLNAILNSLSLSQRTAAMRRILGTNSFLLNPINTTKHLVNSIADGSIIDNMGSAWQSLRNGNEGAFGNSGLNKDTANALNMLYDIAGPSVLNSLRKMSFSLIKGLSRNSMKKLAMSFANNATRNQAINYLSKATAGALEKPTYSIAEFKESLPKPIANIVNRPPNQTKILNGDFSGIDITNPSELAKAEVPANFIKHGIVPKNGNPIVNAMKAGARSFIKAPWDIVQGAPIDAAIAGYQGRYLPLMTFGQKRELLNWLNRYYTAVVNNHVSQGIPRAKSAINKVLNKADDLATEYAKEEAKNLFATYDDVVLDGVDGWGTMMTKAKRANETSTVYRPPVSIRSNKGQWWAARYMPASDKIEIARNMFSRGFGRTHKDIISPAAVKKSAGNAAHEAEHYLQYNWQPYITTIPAGGYYAPSDKGFGKLFEPLKHHGNWWIRRFGDPRRRRWRKSPNEFGAEASGYARFMLGYPEDMLASPYSNQLIDFMKKRFALSSADTRRLLDLQYNGLGLKYGGRIPLAGSY